MTHLFTLPTLIIVTKFLAHVVSAIHLIGHLVNSQAMKILLLIVIILAIREKNR